MRNKTKTSIHAYIWIIRLTLEITTLLKHLSDEANKQKTADYFKKGIHTTTAIHKNEEMLRDFFMLA
jgi:hypothetical protein